jgi:hypothetical protein
VGIRIVSRIIMQAMLPQTRVMCIHSSEVDVIDCIHSFHFLIHLPASSPEKKRQIVKLAQTPKNSVVLVRKRTIPTERPQPAGEVSANFS